MYRAIAKNKRNTVFIIALFLIIIAGLGFAVSLILGYSNPWPITTATFIGAGLYVLYLCMSYWCAGKPGAPRARYAVPQERS